LAKIGVIIIYRKAVYISEDQKDALEDIKSEVEQNGSKVSCMRLMQDAIAIFLDKYREKAVMKYSPMYDNIGDDAFE
jgi:NifU-like protein involved in Fe-S cluster formation